MDESTCSFTFDLRSVQKAFQPVDPKRTILAVLATLVPEPGWDGCLVYTGPAPGEPGKTGCIGTRGSGAGELQRRLVESFERLGITVLELYAGGPEVADSIARVSGGRWVSTES
jgi:hypothetical protein